MTIDKKCVDECLKDAPVTEVEAFVASCKSVKGTAAPAPLKAFPAWLVPLIVNNLLPLIEQWIKDRNKPAAG